MAEDKLEIRPAAEFQALPLEFIVSAPLVAAVRAQTSAAKATRDFIESLMVDGKPITVDFKLAYKEDDKPKLLEISAPLLSIVPVPHLRIESLDVKFKFEISQTVKVEKATDKNIDVKLGAGVALAPWLSASLNGSISSKSSEESTMNRSGQLEISVHASEAPIPEGLAKILSILAKVIDIKES